MRMSEMFAQATHTTHTTQAHNDRQASSTEVSEGEPRRTSDDTEVDDLEVLKRVGDGEGMWI